jgi:hypothetical protein
MTKKKNSATHSSRGAAPAFPVPPEPSSDPEVATVPVLGDAIADESAAELARRLEGALVDVALLEQRYETAKGFVLECELRAALVRKAVREAIVELRNGDGLAVAELADRLAAAIAPPEVRPTGTIDPLDVPIPLEEQERLGEFVRGGK